MKRTNLFTLAEALDDFNNSVDTFDKWHIPTINDCDSYEEYEEALLNEEYQRSKNKVERTYCNIYTCNGKQYVARSLDEAYFMALCEQGIDALGAGVTCENGDFMFTVCLEAYRDYFPMFTDEDFLAYDMAWHYAWTVFDKIKGMNYNEDWEWVEFTKLCDSGFDFIQSNSALARYMKKINWRW